MVALKKRKPQHRLEWEKRRAQDQALYKWIIALSEEQLEIVRKIIHPVQEQSYNQAEHLSKCGKARSE